MSTAPVFSIDPRAFWHDPYPTLKQMRAQAPIAYVPELGATLMVKRDDIAVNEKLIEVFSSVQPDGLMTQLMGQNMMRKDGRDHRAERKAIFPAISPKTVKQVWRAAFDEMADLVLEDLAPLKQADMTSDIARRLAGEALCLVTGLTNMDWQTMDRVSQGLVDGCANYAGDPAIEAHCRDCVETIDRHVSERLQANREQPDHSLLSVQYQAGMSDRQNGINIRLAISGGQNETRDAIAGTIWALLAHPNQRARVEQGQATWLDAFEEYARWMSPIGMSPRRVAQAYEFGGVRFEPEDRVFLMFGSGNRDEGIFPNPDRYDLSQDTTPAISFGAGPHFCAGAWISRCLIAEVVLPKLFVRFENLRLAGEVPFGGWAFRGPLSMPVRWD
ncbi:MAG: cytochrome P450 [Alphaproteobacteria bacterium TMED89]|nr:cytochrome [Rhodospirillaceae bacterium]RPH14246.1 MAG: cytochrome P450 [Alphaproteobacteria bacterium TMED89]